MKETQSHERPSATDQSRTLPIERRDRLSAFLAEKAKPKDTMFLQIFGEEAISPSNDPLKVMRTYQRSLRCFNTAVEELNQFLAVVSRENGFPTPVFLPRADMSHCCNADVASLPVQDMRTALEKDLQQKCDTLLSRLRNGLKRMHEAKHIGTVTAKPNRVFEVTYHTYRTTREKRVAERRTSTSIERDYEKEELHGMHTHVLMEARSEALAASKEPQPRRVQRIIEAAPVWLTHRLRIIHGTAIAERSVEEVVRTHRRTEVIPLPPPSPPRPVFRADPVLALGDFALSGWTSRDMTADRWQTVQDIFACIVFLGLLALAVWGIGAVVGNWSGIWAAIWPTVRMILIIVVSIPVVLLGVFGLVEAAKANW